MTQTIKKNSSLNYESPSFTPDSDSIDPFKLFPFDFKALQDVMLDELLRKRHVLWHAPTGFGKTVIALTSMLYYLLGPQKTINKIIIFVRMKTQVYRILEETYNIASHYFKNYEDLVPTSFNKQDYPPEIISLPLIGKDDMCINPVIASIVHDQDGANIDCVSLKCPFYSASYPQGDSLKELMLQYYLHDLKTTEDIRNFLITELPTCCPYYALKSMLNKTHIVVTTHAWLYNPQLQRMLFEELRIIPENTGIIVDEVHNFRAHLTAELHYKTLKEAVLFANRKNENGNFFLHDLLDLYYKASINEIQPIVKKNDYHLDQLIYTINKYQGVQIPSETDRKGLKALKKVYNFLATEGDLWFFDEIKLINPKTKKSFNEKIFRRVLAYPSSIFEKVGLFQRNVLMSGTLYPPKAYRLLFGLDASYEVVQVLNEPRKILYLTYMKRGLTSRMRNRSPTLFDYQAELIYNLHQLNPRHTLVFSTSKAYTFDLTNYFQLRHPKEEYYIEGSSSQNQILLEKLRLQRHELIFGTLGGSFSEGIEIKDRATQATKINMIIFTGIPHPPPTVTNLLLEKRYIKRFGPKVTTIFLKWLPIYQILLQAAGRGIRRPTDYCIIICLDHRLPGLGIFPKEFSIAHYDWKVIRSLVNNFFK